MDSLKRRYLFKFLSNVTGALFSFVVQALSARMLGPTRLGNFVLLTRFFSDVVNFFDSASSQAFYTKLSQRQRDETLLGFYEIFFLVVSSIILFFTSAVYFFGLAEYVWPGQRAAYVAFACVWALLMWLIQIAQFAIDAHGVTVAAEIIRFYQRLFGLALISTIFFIVADPSLDLFFACQFISLGVLLLGLALVLRRNSVRLPKLAELNQNRLKEIGKEFWTYCSPLVGFSIVALGVGLADRWILQIYGGATQQGYLGLSTQVGVVCFIFTSAMSPLLTRELSVAHGVGDVEAMGVLFLRSAPILFSLAAFLGIFCASESPYLTVLVGGSDFKNAYAAVALMFLYPIHQTYGQLCASVFYATAYTRTYRNIGAVFALMGLPLGIWLILPGRRYGLELGALGIAIKLVAIQFVQVNIWLAVAAKKLKISFSSLLRQQIISLLSLSASAYLAHLISSAVFDWGILRVCLGFLIYLLESVTLGYFYPESFGARRGDFSYLLRIVSRTLVDPGSIFRTDPRV